MSGDLAEPTSPCTPQAVVAKFPEQLLQEWAPVFFLPLVARLVSDASPATRSAVGATLTALLQVWPHPFLELHLVSFTPKTTCALPRILLPCGSSLKLYTVHSSACLACSQKPMERGRQSNGGAWSGSSAMTTSERAVRHSVTVFAPAYLMFACAYAPQRAPPPLLDRFGAYCAQWLAGGDARMRRAAAQTLGLLCGVEGAKFGRRLPPLLPALLASLQVSCTRLPPP